MNETKGSQTSNRLQPTRSKPGQIYTESSDEYGAVFRCPFLQGEELAQNCHRFLQIQHHHWNRRFDSMVVLHLVMVMAILSDFFTLQS